MSNPTTQEQARDAVANMAVMFRGLCSHEEILASTLGGPLLSWDESMAIVDRLMMEHGGGIGIDSASQLPLDPHPVQLAARLRRPEGQDWISSLQEVIRLKNMDNDPAPTVAVTTAGSDPMRGLEIPEEKDVPPFPGRSKWEEWDMSFANFCEVYPTDMPSTLVSVFIARIKNRTQQHTECAFLRPMQAENFALPAGRPDWTTTWKNLREAMCRHFRPHDYVEAHQAAWEDASERLRRARHKHAADYYGDFACMIATYEMAKKREPRLRHIEEQEKVTKFYNALPLEVVNRLRAISGSPWTDGHWEDRRDSVERIWADVFKEKPHTVKGATHRSVKRITDTEADARVLIKRPKTMNSQCILRYMNSRIPADFKGKIRVRQEDSPSEKREKRLLLQRLVKAERCSTCRLTRKEHQQGSPFDNPTNYNQDVTVR